MITDLAPYRQYVDQFDLTEEEKLAWVNALLMIVESIFDLHLGTARIPLKDRDNDGGKVDAPVPDAKVNEKPSKR
jgi:hypothetical protein